MDFCFTDGMHVSSTVMSIVGIALDMSRNFAPLREGDWRDGDLDDDLDGDLEDVACCGAGSRIGIAWAWSFLGRPLPFFLSPGMSSLSLSIILFLFLPLFWALVSWRVLSWCELGPCVWIFDDNSISCRRLPPLEEEATSCTQLSMPVVRASGLGDGSTDSCCLVTGIFGRMWEGSGYEEVVRGRRVKLIVG